MSFRLAIVVSSNPINFINVHFFLHQQPMRIKMRIGEVEWIIAHNCGKQKRESFKPKFSWKWEILDIDIVSQNVPYGKQTTESKLRIVV